jgi:GntR family transcriptional regulator
MRNDGESSPSARVADARPLRSRGSLTDQAKDAILRSIIDGEFVGGLLPREDDLASQLGVSRTTVRAALQALERAGLVARRQGVGTVVNQHVSPARLGLQRLAGFEVLLEESGYRAAIEVEADYVNADAELAARLRVGVGDECFVIRKTFFADGHPAVHVVDAVAAAMLSARPDTARVPNNFYDFFQSYHQLRLDHSVVDISPRLARGETSRRLGLKKDTPLLYLTEHHYTFEGEVMGCSIAEVNDEYLQFSVIRR